MKRTLFSVFVLGLGMLSSAMVAKSQDPAAAGPTATEIIAKCAEAMGGEARMEWT